MLDFSKVDELKPLSRLVRRIQSVTKDDIPFLIVGAQARDLLLKHAHGIDTGRQTADVDFAFEVASWQQFLLLRDKLVESGEFTSARDKLHKLLFRGKLEVDFVPFGPIETPGRAIAWPPDQAVVMSAFGFNEALESSLTTLLPEDISARVVSLPALAVLKLEAWRERRSTHPGKDAHDIKLILTSYLDAGNQDRLYEEFASLLDDEFDYSRAGARILGHDVAALLDDDGLKRVMEIVDGQANPDGNLLLVGDMKLEPSKALDLLAEVRAGMAASF